jgi:hypothetical protein
VLDSLRQPSIVVAIMDDTSPQPVLLEGTIRDLEETMERLGRERAELDQRLSDVRARRDEWRAILARVSKNGGTAKRRRAKKGENLRRISALYGELDAGIGLSMPEIEKRTGIPWSSVRNELQREGAPFIERDGSWFRKEKAGVTDARPHS